MWTIDCVYTNSSSIIYYLSISIWIEKKDNADADVDDDVEIVDSYENTEN